MRDATEDGAAPTERAGRLGNRLRSRVGIDLGTVNTLVYTPKHGVVIEEPSVVAVKRPSGELISVGRPANALYGRAPVGIDVVKPLRDGVISDLEACILMLKGFMGRAFPRSRLRRQVALVCVPGGATDVERKALVEAVQLGKSHLQVKLVEEAVAAALGTGVAQKDARGVLVIDIGGGTTELGVVVEGGCVVSRSIRIAGNEMDSAIVKAVRSEYGLMISERGAERLKMSSGLTGTGEAMTVTGVDVNRRGGLRAAQVTPQLVSDALERSVEAIVSAAIELLAELPADLAGDILDGGVHLAGGGALVPGLSDRVAEETGFGAQVVPDPLQCVVRGLAHLMDRGGQAHFAS